MLLVCKLASSSHGAVGTITSSEQGRHQHWFSWATPGTLLAQVLQRVAAGVVWCASEAVVDVHGLARRRRSMGHACKAIDVTMARVRSAVSGSQHMQPGNGHMQLANIAACASVIRATQAGLRILTHVDDLHTPQRIRVQAEVLRLRGTTQLQ